MENKMSDVYGLIEADAYNKVAIDTWGHLFPEGRYYEGKIRVCETIYGQTPIIDEKIDINASPWWHDAITDFVYKLSSDGELEDGCVYDIDISVAIVDHPEYDEDGELDKCESEFVINTLKLTKVLSSL